MLWGERWIGAAADKNHHSPVLDDIERTTILVCDVRKLDRLLATAASTTFQGTLNESLRKGIVPSHMTKLDHITSLDRCK